MNKSRSLMPWLLNKRWFFDETSSWSCFIWYLKIHSLIRKFAYSGNAGQEYTLDEAITGYHVHTHALRWNVLLPIHRHCSEILVRNLHRNSDSNKVTQAEDWTLDLEAVKQQCNPIICSSAMFTVSFSEQNLIFCLQND